MSVTNPIGGHVKFKKSWKNNKSKNNIKISHSPASMLYNSFVLAFQYNTVNRYRQFPYIDDFIAFETWNFLASK